MIDQREFILALKFAAHSMAKNDVRHYLNGILMEFNNSGISLTASDGHRLAKIDLIFDHELSGSHILSGENVSQILKIFPYNSKIDSQILIEIKGGKIHFSNFDMYGQGASICCGLIDGKYPDADRLIKEHIAKEDKPGAAVNPLYLEEACKASKFIGSRFNAAKITSKGTENSLLLEFTSRLGCMDGNALVLIMCMRT